MSIFKIMKEMTVVLRYPGLFFENRIEKKVSSVKDADTVAKNDKRCNGYEVYEQEEDVVINGTTYTAEPRRIKSVIFGKIYHIDQIRKMTGVDTLISNLESNGKKTAIKTRRGNWLFREKGTKVVDL